KFIKEASGRNLNSVSSSGGPTDMPLCFPLRTILLHSQPERPRHRLPGSLHLWRHAQEVTPPAAVKLRGAVRHVVDEERRPMRAPDAVERPEGVRLERHGADIKKKPVVPEAFEHDALQRLVGLRRSSWAVSVSGAMMKRPGTRTSRQK